MERGPGPVVLARLDGRENPRRVTDGSTEGRRDPRRVRDALKDGRGRPTMQSEIQNAGLWLGTLSGKGYLQVRQNEISFKKDLREKKHREQSRWVLHLSDALTVHASTRKSVPIPGAAT